MNINNDESEYEYQEPPPSLFYIPQGISVEGTNDKLIQTIIELKQIIKNLKTGAILTSTEMGEKLSEHC